VLDGNDWLLVKRYVHRMTKQQQQQRLCPSWLLLSAWTMPRVPVPHAICFAELPFIPMAIRGANYRVESLFVSRPGSLWKVYQLEMVETLRDNEQPPSCARNDNNNNKATHGSIVLSTNSGIRPSFHSLTHVGISAYVSYLPVVQDLYQ
jgi:hypothetical protein